MKLTVSGCCVPFIVLHHPIRWFLLLFHKPTRVLLLNIDQLGLQMSNGRKTDDENSKVDVS